MTSYLIVVFALDIMCALHNKFVIKSCVSFGYAGENLGN